MPITFILTNAGKAAIVAANNTGTNPVTVNRIGVGSASWTPTATATALQTEIKKITAVGGAVVADDTIHVTASDSSSDVYTVREIGLFLTDGTLLAVYSQAGAIITKGADTVALIAADLVITGVPAGSVTVGDTTFDYPQATEAIKGVAEIATTAEAQAGTDDERFLTPAKLQSVTSTETRRGVIELATNAEVQTGTDTSRAVTPAGLASRTATETRTGVIEIATDAEVLAGTDTDRAVTPSGLASRTATTTRTGIVELATDAEVQTGTDNSRAVTPGGLSSRTATATRTGLIELATQAETDTGTDTERAVTPQTLRLFPGSARAWVSFRGTGTVAVFSSRGVTSVTDLGPGLYQINWSSAFDSTNYAWVGTARSASDGFPGEFAIVSPQSTQTKSTSALRIRVAGDGGAALDSPEVNVVAFA
jgi:hypothetical protein